MQKFLRPALLLQFYYLYKNAVRAPALGGIYHISSLADLETVEDSQLFTDKLAFVKEFSWDFLILKNIRCGELIRAFVLYEQMQEEQFLYPRAGTFVALLKACVRLNDQERALKLTAAIVRVGMMETNSLIGRSVLCMYISFNWAVEAQYLLDDLPPQSVFSWTALITRWVKNGCGKEALCCFEKMQLYGVPPDAVTYVAGLKSCSLLKAFEKGAEMHAEIERKGLLGTNLTLGNSLVHMYAKCGSITLAQEVFDLLPSRDIASWTVLIAGFVEAGNGEEALKFLALMQQNSVSPNDFTYTSSLKACSIARKLYEGQEIHAEIEAKTLLAGNTPMGNALVDMYAKCGLLTEAEQLFDKYIICDVVSWNVLIGGYIEHGHGREALHCFKQMQVRGVSANVVTFASSLKACAIVGDIDEGLELHAEIVRKGTMERDMVIGCALVAMYAQCSLLDKAQQVFDKLLVRNVLTWNALMLGYAEHGHGEKAISCFKKMQSMGISPDSATIICCLKAYVSIGAICKVDEIVADMESSSARNIDVVLGTAIVDIYAKHGFLQKARHVFDKLHKRNIVSWNSLVAGYAEHEQGVEALNCLAQMQLEGLLPNAITLVCGLKACSSTRDMNKGMHIHSEILRKNLLRKDLYVGSSIVDMYAKCGALDKALEVFEELPLKSAILYNALIGGFVEHGFGEQAIFVFQKMKEGGVSPDLITYICVLKACGIIGAIDEGWHIHTEIQTAGMLENVIIGNALVGMFAKCGRPFSAQGVFDNISARSIVTWNTMLVGCVEYGLCEEALQYFEKMQLEGVSPNYVSFLYCVKACGSLGATEKGRELHAEIERLELLPQQDLVGAGLVEMYGKCGLLNIAQQAFDKLPCRSIVSWNFLISGYAEQGEGNDVFDVFGKMLGEGLKPDSVTFVIVLGVCSQTCSYERGQTYFDAISEVHGIAPTLQHQTCMINLFGRAGELDKVVTLIKVPSCLDLALWRSVLVACIKWGNMELGRVAFEQAVCLAEKDA